MFPTNLFSLSVLAAVAAVSAFPMHQSSGLASESITAVGSGIPVPSGPPVPPCPSGSGVHIDPLLPCSASPSGLQPSESAFPTQAPACASVVTVTVYGSAPSISQFSPVPSASDEPLPSAQEPTVAPSGIQPSESAVEPSAEPSADPSADPSAFPGPEPSEVPEPEPSN